MGRISRTLRLAGTVALVLVIGGCGLQIKGADLFLLKRMGHGPELALLVNDGGTISCNGGWPKNIPDSLLLQARDLASELDGLANLELPVPHNSIFHYYIVLPYGSVSFPDTAGVRHPLLAQVEQFALRASQRVCHLHS